ncbi:histidine phosphatase family protein [Euzebya tangerina]|uniref:histidine phosphatase family protein n=1 Tax=Euzebya tangerina TaxID=591198 RepID=UPI000E324D9A|nr:histidine phosphatase family protein [Euzebya tangerina]
MELVLIRHAQPAWRTADGTSTNDPELTSLGQVQADRVAKALAAEDRPVDGLFSSTARRAVATARPIEQALGTTATAEPWALEIGPPDAWEGQPEDDVIRVLESLKTRPLDEWWEGAPGSESFRDFHTRITSGLEDFLGRFGGRRHVDDPARLWDVPDDGPRLMLVAHAGTNSVITSHLLGLDPQPWEWERFPCNHASITVLRSRPIATADMWALEHFSDVGHLLPDLVTA